MIRVDLYIFITPSNSFQLVGIDIQIEPVKARTLTGNSRPVNKGYGHTCFLTELALCRTVNMIWIESDVDESSGCIRIM